MKKWIFSIFVTAIVGIAMFSVEPDKHVSVKEHHRADPADRFHESQTGVTRYRVSGEGKIVNGAIVDFFGL